MPVTIGALIATYGYPALFVGTLLEGEAILLLAGLAAHLGHLRLSLVLLVGFCGGLLGDQLYYRIGRTHGAAFLAKHPSWSARVARATRLLRTHRLWVIFFFRFLYGLRTVTPFAIGVAGVRPGNFVPLNVLAVALWAVIVGGGGYLFGSALELMLGKLKRMEVELLASLALLAVLLWLAHVLIGMLWRHREKCSALEASKEEAEERKRATWRE